MPVKPRWFRIQNKSAAHAVPTIQLFGDIGVSKEPDWFWGGEPGAGTFQEFASELAALGNPENIRVEIFSYGGDVVVGKGFYDKLAEHPAHKTAVIYGVCASAATYAALACDEIQIPANSFFLIHNSTGICWGTAEEMERYVANLRVCDKAITKLYAARTGMSEEEVAAIMDKDTWMTGEDAADCGLADTVIEAVTVEPSKKLEPDNFSASALRNMPANARLWFDTRSLKKFTNSAKSQPPTNTAMLTEAQLKEANEKLERDKLQIINDANAEAKRIKEAAEADAVKIKNAAKPPGEGQQQQQQPHAGGLTRVDLDTAIKNAVDPLQLEIKTLRETGLKNLAGGPPVPGVKPPGEGEPEPPKNEAELRERLKNCKNHAERSALIREFDAAKKK